MKNIMLLALVLLIGLPLQVAAQAKPDLSGTWTFDEAKSDPAPARGGGRGGGGRMGGAPATAMTIKQSPAELTIDRTTPMGAQTVVYKLDGSESTNAMGMGSAKSTASWSGSTLVITSTMTMQGRGGGEMTVDSKEVYSREGNVLTVETTRTTQFGTQTRKLVYTRN